MTDPFPTPYATLLGDDPQLQTSLDTAVAQTRADSPDWEDPGRLAISLVSVEESTLPVSFSHAGIGYGRTYYSASLLKVGAMYAAFELRKRVNDFIAEQGVGTAQQLFGLLPAHFDDAIVAKVPLINATAGITRAMKVPKYQQIFTAADSGVGLVADFTDPFRRNLFDMIINSSNAAAAGVITALGYSWINGTLHAGGFFFPPASDGIWLAGTFTGAFPAVRIPCINDVDTAQGTSTFDIANMYAHILSGTLVDSVASTDFSAHLQVSAAQGADPSFMVHGRPPRDTLPVRNFDVTHTKIGLGPLKTNRVVISEGAVVQHRATEHRFIVVWQNSYNLDGSVFAMGLVVERAISLFLGQP